MVTVSRNQLQLASQTSLVTVSGCVAAVAGGIQHSVPVVGWWAYSMALCGLNQWDGGLSPLLSREQGGEQAGGAHPRRSAVRRGKDGEEGDSLPLLTSFISYRLSASQRCGLPAGSPRDLASLGLREHRGGDCRGMWPAQLCCRSRRRGCRCQAAGRGWCGYT